MARTRHTAKVAKPMAVDVPPVETAATVQEQPIGVQMSGQDYSRLSFEDLGRILRLNAEGLTQRAIADVVECSQASVGYALKRMSGDAKEVQALAKGKAVDALLQWNAAIATAAKRGDHRPAREFIELAHAELRPTAGNTGAGGGVTINIGMPGQPLELPVIDVRPTGLSPQVSQDMHSLTVANKAVGDA